MRFKMPTQNVIDKTVNYLFPKTGVKRMQARIQMEVMNSFKQLSHRSAYGPLDSRTNTEEEALPYYDRLKMIALHRKMERENPLFAGALEQLVTNTVGTKGILPISDTPNQDFNKRADEIFDKWADDCTLDGGKDFAECQDTHLRSVLRDGDYGTLLTRYGKIQEIEGDRVATPPKLMGMESQSIFQGVQIGAKGPAFYWVGSRNKYGTMDKFTPVPARDFIHSFFRNRAASSLRRGISKMLPAADNFRDFEDIMSYAKFQQKMAACFGIAIYEDSGAGNPLSGIVKDDADPTAKKPLSMDMFPGMAVRLRKGEKIETVDNKNPGNNFDGFINLVCRVAGLPEGLPIELILLDFHRGNFSSQRMAMQAAYKTFLKNHKIEVGYSARVRAWVLERKIREGELIVPDDIKNTDYLSCIWPEPVHPSIDPEGEINASIDAVDHCLSTLEIECRKRGLNWRKVLRQRGIEITQQREDDVPVVIGKPGSKTINDIETASQSEKLKKEEKEKSK
jgi:capsid protein